MQKPIRPKKPKPSDSAPKQNIYVVKLLVSDGVKFCLIDEISHPDIFTHEGLINDELIPCYDALYEAGFSSDFQVIKYSDYKKIAADCNMTSDFEVIRNTDRNGHYQNSFIRYLDVNSNYKNELIEYNNRFNFYDVQMSKFENDLKLYNEYKMSQKRLKLEKQLKELNK